MSIGIIHRFKMVDIQNQERQRFPEFDYIIHETFQIGFKITPVIKARKAVDQRHGKSLLVEVTQTVLKALSADLGAGASNKLVIVQRFHNVIVCAEIKCLCKLYGLLWLAHHQKRNLSRSFLCPEQGQQPQRVLTF